MSKGISRFFVHTITAEMFTGTNGHGEDTFAAAVTVVGLMDGARKLIRGADGDEVVSEATFFTYPVNAPLFVAESRVTYNGDVSRVVKTSVNDAPGLNLPDHVAVNLL